jgi:hypothetical protein
LAALATCPHLCDHDHRGLLVEHLIDGHHAAHLHQRLDDLGRLDRHLVREIADGDGLRHHDFAHDRLGGRDELRRVFRDRSRGLVSPALWGMPSGGALDVSARLDRPALDAFVLPDLDLLGLLRALFFGSWRDLRFVQRRVGGGGLGLTRLLLGFARELALALLLLCQLGRLAGRQLLLAASLSLAQFSLARVDRGARRNRRLGWTELRLALDEDALFLDLDLNGARLAARVRFLDDLGGLLAR